MTCDHCRAKVAEALRSAEGVYGASVDLESTSAEVEFDTRKVTTEQLVAAVEAVGYGAQVAS